MKQLLDKNKKKYLLDIGCGSGFLLSKMEGQFDRVFGLDVSPEACEEIYKSSSGDCQRRKTTVCEH
jgi:methylase of polypeptide subunit release factors